VGDGVGDGVDGGDCGVDGCVCDYDGNDCKCEYDDDAGHVTLDFQLRAARCLLCRMMMFWTLGSLVACEL
jgi:hypothetical protein